VGPRSPPRRGAVATLEGGTERMWPVLTLPSCSTTCSTWRWSTCRRQAPV
jgi:hypothetical protein